LMNCPYDGIKKLQGGLSCLTTATTDSFFNLPLKFLKLRVHNLHLSLLNFIPFCSYRVELFPVSAKCSFGNGKWLPAAFQKGTKLRNASAPAVKSSNKRIDILHSFLTYKK
jgi:hypothetical protein